MPCLIVLPCVFSINRRFVASCIKEGYWHRCPTALAHSVSLCPTLVILVIFQHFLLIIFVMVISDDDLLKAQTMVSIFSRIFN